MASPVGDFKIAYRRLIRKLHPDLTGGEGRLGSWQKALWDRAQAAYRRQDKEELEKIYLLAILRARDFAELTLSEIHASRSWLEEELSRIRGETSDLKRLPAWGFSRKKNHDNLKAQIEKEIRLQRRSLEDEIKEIKDQIDFLELQANANAERRARGQRGAQKKRRSYRRSRSHERG